MGNFVNFCIILVKICFSGANLLLSDSLVLDFVATTSGNPPGTSKVESTQIYSLTTQTTTVDLAEIQNTATDQTVAEHITTTFNTEPDSTRVKIGTESTALLNAKTTPYSAFK